MGLICVKNHVHQDSGELIVMAPIQHTNPATMAPIQPTNPATMAPIQPTNPATIAPIQPMNPATMAPTWNRLILCQNVLMHVFRNQDVLKILTTETDAIKCTPAPMLVKSE